MSPIEDAASDWQTLDTTFYRNEHLYDLTWPIKDLSHHYVAVDKNGGSIALLRNLSIPTPYTQSTPSASSPTIFIYSSSSVPLLQIPLSTSLASSSTSSTPFHTPVLLAYTPSRSHLVLLADDGSYRLYAPNSPEFETRSIGGEVGVEGVREAKAYDGGMVVLTHGGRFWDVPFSSAEGGGGANRPRRLADVVLPEGYNEGEGIGAWEVFDSNMTESRTIQLVLSVASTLITLDEQDSIDQRISRGPFLSIHPSPSGRLLALLIPAPPSSPADGPSIWVVSSDFQTNHATIPYASLLGVSSDSEAARWVKGGGRAVPDQVVWCGEDAVAVAWSKTVGTAADGKVVVCGPGGESIVYPYSSSASLVSEVDGLRIISSTSCDFVQKVPAPLLSLLLPGSSHPSSLLLEAYALYLAQSPRSSALLTLLRPDLSMAVAACLDAASELWEPEQQKYVMRAAIFGRSFLDGEGDAGVVECGKALKVMNCLRGWEVGVPISYQQYIRLPPTTLLSLLTSRALYLLSLKIATHLSLDPDPILEHWACAKIARAGGREDVDVCREIVGKLGRKGGRGRYAGIAKTAWGSGRKGLATMLLDHEPRASDQVPLLLDMKEDNIALDKAISSGDTDLVYHVLLHLKSHIALGDFFRLVDDRPTAAALLEIYAREQDRAMLKDFYYQDDRRVANAALAMEDALRAKNFNDRLAALKAASKFFYEDKDRSFESTMMSDYEKLTSLQRDLDKELLARDTAANPHPSLLGLSVNETMRECIVLGLPKRADQLRSKFSVPDKRFYYVKLYALVSIRDFQALESFVGRKSPIGFEPFVKHLVSKGHPKEASKYVARCDKPSRVQLYVLCNDYTAAAAECKANKDKEGLAWLARQAPTTLIQRDIQAVLSSMNR